MPRDLFEEAGIKPGQPRDLFAERGIAPTTERQKMLGSGPMRFGTGLLKPIVGAGELLAKGLAAGEEPGTFLGDLGKTYDDYWKPKLDELNQAEKAAGFGDEGDFNAAGLAGTVLSPVNFAAANLGPVLGGAVAGASEPVMGSDYWTKKAVQTGIGGIAGGVAGKVAEKLGGATLARKALPEDVASIGAKAESMADDALNKLNQDGIDISAINPDIVANIRKQLIDAGKQSKTLDAAALLRKQDFDALSIQPLQGQLTRDPVQFSREQNLRGVVPELTGILNKQQHELTSKVGRFADGASDSYNAGKAIIDPLEGVISQQKAAQNELYSSARDQAGRYAQVNTKQFSDMANYALDSNMLGHYLPKETKRLLNDISSGKVPLNVNNLVQADSVLSEAQRAAKRKGDNAAALAISKVREALNQSDVMDEAGVTAKQAFDKARSTARQHFKLREEIPALGAVADGDAIPDNFVQRYIINEKSADNVKRLSTLLPDKARQEARAQIGLELKRAAMGEFGETVAPERFNKALRKLGRQKLSAFFSDAEIDELSRIGRVAAYISKEPAAATVNRSNTAVTLMQESPLVRSLFGDSFVGRLLGGTAKAATGAVKNQMAAANAMNTNITPKNAPLTPEQLKVLSFGLGITGAESGRFFAPGFE